MKQILTATVILSLLFAGCQSQSGKEENKATELPEKETEMIQDKGSEQKSEIASDDKNETTQAPLDENYVLADKSVGKFTIGQAIPFPTSSDDYKVKKETLIRNTEEGPSEETLYIVSIQGNELMQIKPAYDANSGQETIREMIITSSEIKTPKGIGVGTTLEDFIAQYPDYNMWYTYISGMYVIETEDVDAQFILNEKDFVGNLTISGEMTTLKKTDFKEGATILKIRVI